VVLCVTSTVHDYAVNCCCPHRPVNLLDFVAALPFFLQPFGLDQRAYRFLRIVRVLRLLRLVFINRRPEAVLFGCVKSDDVTVQITSILVEFTCIISVAAALIYDVEVGRNEYIHSLGDTLYWAFFTLTGNGQPFELATGAGKSIAILASGISLIVLPVQIAKAGAISGGRFVAGVISDMEKGMDEDESEDKGRSRAAVAGSSGQVAGADAGDTSSPDDMADRRGVSDTAEDLNTLATVLFASSSKLSPLGRKRRFRRVAVTERVCDSCGKSHDPLPIIMQ